MMGNVLGQAAELCIEQQRAQGIPGYPKGPAKGREGHAGELVAFVAHLVQHRFPVDLCQLLTNNLVGAARGEGWRLCGYPLVVVLLAHANPLLLMCPVESPQFCVELGPKSLILPLLKLHQLLLPTKAAGVWVPSLMGVVKRSHRI